MSYIRTPHATLHYEEAGSGPHTLVLLHGNFGSPRWWQPLLKRLPPGFRALLPVLRGCAGTLGGHSDYSIGCLASDLRDFAQALKLSSFHLVGHSLGGAVALQYALDFPGSLLSLGLVAPAPPTGLAALREGGGLNAQALRMLDPEHSGMMALVQSIYQVGRVLGAHRVVLRDAMAEMVPPSRLTPTEFDMLVHDASSMSTDALVGFARALGRWNVEARLGELRTPTLLLAGGKDTLVPPDAMRRLAQALPRCRLELWPEAGHSPQLEQPELFARTLFGFLGRRSPRLFVQWAWGQLVEG